MQIFSSVFLFCQPVIECSMSDCAVGAAVQYSAVDVCHSGSEVLPKASLVIPPMDVRATWTHFYQDQSLGG